MVPGKNRQQGCVAQKQTPHTKATYSQSCQSIRVGIQHQHESSFHIYGSLSSIFCSTLCMRTAQIRLQIEQRLMVQSSTLRSTRITQQCISAVQAARMVRSTIRCGCLPFQGRCTKTGIIPANRDVHKVDIDIQNDHSKTEKLPHGEKQQATLYTTKPSPSQSDKRHHFFSRKFSALEEQQSERPFSSLREREDIPFIQQVSTTAHRKIPNPRHNTLHAAARWPHRARPPS